jgi:hypothetical protein
VTNSTTLEISASAGFTPSGTLTFTGSQGDEAVAIGQSAGSTNQGSGAVAVGGLAGYNLQGDNAVAVGGLAGNNSQGTQAVAVGLFAGQEDQGQFSVAIGGGAGQQTQGEESVAIGAGAGSTVQGNAAVAIGGGAGAANQRINSVAIGASAGAGTQGQYAVAIGASAGVTNQGNNSIILNATGANLNQTTANTFTVAPVRNDVANTAQVMFYNDTSKEITYGNTISVAGNITGGNLTVGSGTITGGNVNGANFNGNVAFGTGTVGGSGNITGGNLLFGSGSVSGTGNITCGNLSVTGNITSNISFTGANITINNAPGGNEGAEIFWALPAPANTVLSTSLVQDVFQNGMRFFEGGGNSRGLYMDLGNVPNGAGTAVGYRDIPQVSLAANATIAATDAGRHYYSTSASNLALTIANNTSVSWSVGTAISVVNRGTANIIIVPAAGVSLYLAGNATSANRVVTTYGMATMINVEANIWMIDGTVV